MADMTKKIIRVFIDADVICLDHFSGIGHYTASLLKDINSLLENDKYKHIKITLGAPRRSFHRVESYGFNNFKLKKMPTSHRITNGLRKRDLLPPIDLIFGKQIYVFPNYSSWPTTGSPVVPIVYDLSYVLHPEFADDNNRIFLEKQVRLSAKRATRIITISKNSKKEISEYYKYESEKIEILYPIIDKRVFYKRSEREIKKVMARYGIFDKCILFVGNIEPRKNLISLLRAYEKIDPELQKKYPLLLVGAKGWKDEEIHDHIEAMRAKDIKIIQPSDYVSDQDMPALISGAKIFTYISKYEGFGIPPVEAMFCGTPVISSNNSSLPEATGNAALMVDADSISEITKAIESLLTNDALRHELTMKGYEHIKKPMFAAGQSGEKFLKLIESIK